MVVRRISFYSALGYAKDLISQGMEKEKACRLSAHRFDESLGDILKQIDRKKTILFYEGPVYLINVNDKKDIKKIKIAIKISCRVDMKESKRFIEKHYSKNPYRGLIKCSDWKNARLFSSLSEYQYFCKKKQ